MDQGLKVLHINLYEKCNMLIILVNYKTEDIDMSINLLNDKLFIQSNKPVIPIVFGNNNGRVD